MPKVSIRYQRVADAERFFEILNNPRFIYWRTVPKTLDDERKWLEENSQRRKKNIAWNLSVLYGGKVVGGCGIMINQHRKYIGEIGYFIDELYWNKGIATKAVRLVEKVGFKKLGLTRIEILMQTKNRASEKVAIKCGYKKEGLMRKAFLGRDGRKKDMLLYAKVL